MHTGQHWDDELSQVFIDELGLDEPAHRLDLRTADVDRLTPPIAAVLAAETPDVVLVLGDTNSTLAGARAAVAAGVPLAHVEAGLRSGDLSMPEERARIEVDGLATLLLCPDERSAATLRDEGAAGRVEVVGDVMADATLRFAPIARERVPPPHAARHVRRRDHPPGGERAPRAPAPDRRGPLADRGARRAARPPANRVGARGARRSRSARTSSCASRWATSRSRPPRRRRGSSRPTRAGSRRRRTGIACRASRCARRPSGSTRSRSARTCSSTTTRTRSPRRSGAARFPPDAPPLYGDGHAAARVADALLASLAP